MKVIEFDESCKSCDGTGLYIGMAERDGAEIVCHTCKGTGCYHFKYEYEDFVKRKQKPMVIRVFNVNVGIIIGTGNGHRLEDFGGMTIKEWEDGKPFIPGMENRKYTCPAWWYQTANYSKKPDWEECGCCGTFSSCKHFYTREKCWKRWDKENR